MTLGRAWRGISGAARRQAGAAAIWLLRQPELPAWGQAKSAQLAARTPTLRSLGLSELTAESLLAISRDQELRWLLEPNTEIDVGRLLDLALERPDLDAALRARLRSANDHALSQELHRTIVADQPEHLQRLVFALTVAALAAARLTPEHRRAIFARCLEIVREPTDPYDGSAAVISGSARQAASAILAIDSSFDDEVLEALSEPAVRASVQALAASALKERPDEAAERFARYAGAIAPSRETLIRFAEDCDADRSSLRSVLRPRPSAFRRAVAWLKRLRPPGSFWYLVALLLPPLAALGLAVACRHASGSIVDAGIDPGVAIGALALLAAVHVLAVQLAAQRLPGPIAAGTVATPVTMAAYVAGILALVASILGKEKPSPDWNPALVGSGLLVILIGLAIATTLLSLRNTTVAPATESVGRRRIRQAKRSGHRVGRLHRAAVDTHELLSTEPSIRQFTSPQENVHRVKVLSPATGFARLDPGRLKQAVSARPWRVGDIRLDLLVASGVRVSTGQEVASVVPAAGSDVQERDIATVERAFSVHKERSLERCAELCVSLCSQLPLLVRAGDPDGAGRVLQVLLALLDAHVTTDKGQWSPTDGVMPMSPVLVQTLDQGLADMRNATSESEREMSGRLLKALIDRSKNDDGVVALLAVKLRRANTQAEFDVLYRAGCRAALTGSRLGLLTAQKTFDHLTAGTDDMARCANEYAGRLVLYCASVAPRLSRTAWSNWWATAGTTYAGDHRDLAVRIGAGSLPFGNLSLAVEIALELHGIGVDFDAMIAAAHSPERAAFERFLSESYGRLLGSDAEQRIVDFLTFAQTVRAAVTCSST